MKKYILQVVVVVFALFSILTSVQAVDFLPPKQRPLLNMDKPWPKNHFLALCYHDVQDDSADERYLAVRTSALNDQMAWLHDNGYTAISVQQILDAHNGGKPLPDKSVLLSFDDGFSSFYSRVYPLLKAYNWPALWAPVGQWLATPADKPVDFGGELTDRKLFSDWEIVREIKNSPLVEIGSHTWDSHFGAQANPEGSKKPVMANRLYDPIKAAYETDEAFRQRLETDVRKITQKIKEVSGKSPIAWVWPYGAANGTALSIIKEYGYKMAFTLQTGLANAEHLSSIPRVLISGNPSIDVFASQVTQFEEKGPTRVMHVDLDYVYDADPVQQAKNVDALIQRVYDMKTTHVFLQAYADPQGDGTVKELYFPNRWLPMRADLFNYISWQLQTRANAKVYAWMPVLAFDLDKKIPRVQSWSADGTIAEPAQYQRVSPWSPVARQQITEIYEDLASHAVFHGILFHDDALLSDFEDASSDALAAYKAAGLGNDIASIRNSPEQFQAWSRYKSKFLIDFTKDLTQAVRNIRGPHVKTARNIYAKPILEPETEEWFAQNFNDFLQTYDWTAVMAMPLMEGVSLKESNKWLKQLVETTMKHEGARNKVLFELQTLDWSNQGGEHKAIPSSQLAEWMYQLQMSGARHYGYYPDDFLSNHPDLKTIRPAFSSYWYPNHD